MTNTDSIELLLTKDEGETIEFKESFDEESLESISATWVQKRPDGFWPFTEPGGKTLKEIGKE